MRVSTQSSSERELALLRGFVPYGWAPRDGERRRLARQIYARVVAVELASDRGTKVPLKEIADVVGVSERTLSLQFGTKEALFAFPPPEFARAIVGSCARASTFAEADASLRLLFADLDKNLMGKRLLVGLAKLQRLDPTLERADNHFGAVLREELRACEAPDSWIRWGGYLASGLTDAFRRWATTPSESIVSVVADVLDDVDIRRIESAWRASVHAKVPSRKRRTS